MLRGKGERAYKKHYLNLLKKTLTEKTLTDENVPEIKKIRDAIKKIEAQQKKFNQPGQQEA